MATNPLSFALEGSNVVQQTPSRAAPVAPVSAGQGTGSTFRQAPARPDPTVALLMELGGDILGPRVKQEAQRQFVAGVRQAQSGKAIGEIVDESPWYANIFGPSAAVSGARAYASQAAINKWAAGMEARMPELAQLTPEAMEQEVNAGLQSFMTGDPETDNLVTQAAAEQMGTLFKQHTKAHYIYNQNAAMEGQFSAWEAAGNSLQSQLASPVMTEEDKQAATARFLGQLSPFGDQTEESYNNNVTRFLQGQAQAGNFQVIKMFRDTPFVSDDGTETTLWKKLPADQRQALDRAMPAMAAQALNKAMPKYALDVALLLNDTAQDPRLLPERVKAINDKVREETGITEADLIPPGSLDNAIGGILRAQASANAQAAAEQAKIGMARVMAQQPGGLATGKAVGAFGEQQAESAQIEAWGAAQTTAAKAQVLNLQPTTKSSAIAAQLQSWMQADEANSGTNMVSAIYGDLTDETKGLYFDADQRSQLDRATRSIRAGVDPAAAWTSSRVLQPVAEALLPEKERTAVQKTLASYVDKRNSALFGYGFSNLTDSSLRMVEAMTAKDYKADRVNNTVEAAVARSYNRALSNGLDVVGKHAIISATGRNQTPLTTLVGGGSEETAKAFDAVLETQAKSIGTTLDNYSITRVPDRGDQAYFYVETTTEDGRTLVLQFGSQDVRKQLDSVRSTDVARSQASSYVPGGRIVGGQVLPSNAPNNTVPGGNFVNGQFVPSQ